MSLLKPHNSVLTTQFKEDSGMMLCGCCLGNKWELRERAWRGSCWSGVSGAPALPIIPGSLSGDSQKEARPGLGTHVYFMNDFRERGEKSHPECHPGGCVLFLMFCQ